MPDTDNMQPLVKLNRMTSEAFHATTNEPVTDITRDPGAALDVDIWPYVEVAMAAEFSDQNTSRWDVRHVYREAENRYQHVFVRTHRRRLFLVIVLAVADQSIVGHYVLDMKAEYR